jgi:hypothetical protein
VEKRRSPARLIVRRGNPEARLRFASPRQQMIGNVPSPWIPS